MKLRIGLIGDYNPSVIAHQAIPRALALAGGALALVLPAAWGPPAGSPGAGPASGMGAYGRDPGRCARGRFRRALVCASQPLPEHGRGALRDPVCQSPRSSL